MASLCLWRLLTQGAGRRRRIGSPYHGRQRCRAALGTAAARAFVLPIRSS